jgi:hypothetical protein
MGYRIHTTATDDVAPVYVTKMVKYFDDDEMDDVGPGIVLDDRGNMEAFVIQGSTDEIRKFAHRIIDALPLALTKAEKRYLKHVCKEYGYDRKNAWVSRDNDGIAWMEPDEDAITYDLTNEFQRSRSIEAD